ncbi:MAG: hypothetical protein A3A44_00980 [Candidatus Sungbacteria bacterium RIFCSPLOWO2_01_FULL_60_25]|uniref:Mannose-6-phosphate isomerase type II C-terminal domain-containing protein n=1 Tax=Candidatus Sungbacteria bacterium RIFCSPLOWO2_01_FULL_60_25 TaxID=1802281 RepID=A0A1G2LCJ6_9BACT|nr:MAG: hypothetical protein A3A44_00980 [Candidatus Sungbacteria bacterium RIFCSPLOWO2_01_FULL_60_25]
MISVATIEALETSSLPRSETLWGKEFFVLGGDGASVTVKIIWVNPGARLSLQSHERRDEQWTILSNHGGMVSIETPSGALLGDSAQRGAVHRVRKTARHRLAAPSDHPLVVLEVAFGKFDQSDIKRYEDDYGRAG